MKSLHSKLKYIVIGLIIGSFLSGSVAFASGYSLSLFQAKIVINGVEKQGENYQYYNGQSYVPTALNYNGTTYVPLRLFSEALGESVKYVSDDKTIYVGEIPNDQVVSGQYMSDIMKPYYETSSVGVNKAMKMAGNNYSKGYQLFAIGGKEQTISFNLEKKYTNISGLIGMEDNFNGKSSSINIYGDEKLIKTISLPAGELPQSITLDVSGISKLDIKYINDSITYSIDLVNWKIQ